VHVMRGSWRNIKITRPEDLPLAEFLLSAEELDLAEPGD
jgi:2-C-methyl-D-erythritol 4-phosphate cytidylyltransferase